MMQIQCLTMRGVQLNNIRVVAAIGADLFFEPAFVRRANSKFNKVLQHYRPRGVGLEGLASVQLASCQFPKPDPLARSNIYIPLNPMLREVSRELLRFVVVRTKEEAAAVLPYIDPAVDLLVQIIIDDDARSELWDAPVNIGSMATITAAEVDLEEIFLSVALDIGTANSDVFRECIKLFSQEVFGDLSNLFKSKVAFARSRQMTGIPPNTVNTAYIPFLDRTNIPTGNGTTSLGNEIQRLTRWLEFLTDAYNKKYWDEGAGFYKDYVAKFSVPRRPVCRSLKASLLSGGPAARFILFPGGSLTEQERSSLLGDIGRLNVPTSKVKPALHWNRWWALLPAEKLLNSKHALTLCSEGRIRVVPTI